MKITTCKGRLELLWEAEDEGKSFADLLWEALIAVRYWLDGRK